MPFWCTAPLTHLFWFVVACLRFLQAAAAREHVNPQARLRGSMLGQAMARLHFQDPERLRLGYTHPMDDGQQRAFKVKFEGEGVDDYGGPYRECFAQFAQELQATNDNASGFGIGVSRASAGTSAAANSCVLPLLTPSANRRSGTGANKDGFVLDPAVGRAVRSPAADSKKVLVESATDDSDEGSSHAADHATPLDVYVYRLEV